MKKTAFILLAAILLGLMPQGVHAQYASTGDSDLTLQKENLYTGQGQRLTDAGKTIMLTGASFAMTGLTVFLAGALTYDYDPCCPTMPLYPVFGALGGIAGAAIALVGLPIYCNGKKQNAISRCYAFRLCKRHAAWRRSNRRGRARDLGRTEHERYGRISL